MEPPSHPDPPMMPTVTVSIALRPSSKFVAYPHSQYPRPNDGLRLDELVRVGEHAGILVGQVLAVEGYRPIVFRHPGGGIVGVVAVDLVTGERRADGRKLQRHVAGF